MHPPQTKLIDPRRERSKQVLIVEEGTATWISTYRSESRLWPGTRRKWAMAISPGEAPKALSWQMAKQLSTSTETPPGFPWKSNLKITSIRVTLRRRPAKASIETTPLTSRPPGQRWGSLKRKFPTAQLQLLYNQKRIVTKLVSIYTQEVDQKNWIKINYIHSDCLHAKVYYIK